jgi:hypothetical protein
MDSLSEYSGSSYLCRRGVLIVGRVWCSVSGCERGWLSECGTGWWLMASCCDQASVIAMMSSGGGEVQYRRDRGMCAQTMR